MLTITQQFDEVRVVEGIGERTGTIVDRNTVRGSKVICRSVRELSRKVRHQGDGYFYLATRAWPEDTTRLVLTDKWTSFSESWSRQSSG